MAQPEENPREPAAVAGVRSAGKGLYWTALVVLYLLALLMRLPVADFDEPDLTYGDEMMTIGQAETLLRNPNGKIQEFHKPPGVPHLLRLLFPLYYGLAKERFGWLSIEDVQWWRVRHFWRAANILLSALIVFLVGAIGARKFGPRAGLLAAALCTVSTMCNVWFSFLKEEGLMCLAIAVAVYAAARLDSTDRRRRSWLVLGGLATGCALAFKYNAAPVVVFFLLVLFLAPRPGEPPNVAWRARLRGLLPEAVLYGVVSLAIFLVWFPQLILRFADVWRSATALPQISSLDFTHLELPSSAALLSVAWAAWRESFWHSTGLGDTFPLYFFLLLTGILIVAPFQAAARRRGFVLALSAFAWLTYLLVYYQWLFSGWRFSHYFLPAILPIYLLTADGLDRLCGWIAARWFRPAGWRRALRQPVLLAALCAWPLCWAGGVSLERLAEIRSSVGGREAGRALRREIVRALPAGAKVFVLVPWRRPFISDAFLDNHNCWPSRGSDWKDLTWQDLILQGYDYAGAEIYGPWKDVQEPAYLRELSELAIEPDFFLPRVSRLSGQLHYIPVQWPADVSYRLGLYAREPSAGDYAGIRGRLPRVDGYLDESTSRDLVLKVRLSNPEKWFPRAFRWEIRSNGRILWQGRELTDDKQVSLALPFRARAGGELALRTLRIAYYQNTPRGWGGPQAELKVDGLEVLAADTHQRLPVRWTYTGVNGGPGPAPPDGRPCYAMRTDWWHNENPVPLLDGDFDGPQPLVEAWRPYQLIEPTDPKEFPGQEACRRMARIERVLKQGLSGSPAIRLHVAYPAKESATLGIAQPIAYPAAQQLESIHVHYRVGGLRPAGGAALLRLRVTGRSLSGEYIDRAERIVPLPEPPPQWNVLKLEVRKAWELQHTRVDLIDFLEVAIEVVTGPGVAASCLLDNVELEREAEK